MSYTKDALPHAEQYVDGLVRRCVSAICRDTRPIAIFLQGGFGRGEGIVRTGPDGNPSLWRDLDITIVYRRRVDPKRLQRLREELLQLPGVLPSGNTATGGDISLAQLPITAALRWRDLKMLELAAASKHLHGEDIRPRMAVADGRIPAASGQRFLLNKTIGLSLVRPLIATGPGAANYEISKLYAEILSALALREGKASPFLHLRAQACRNSSDSFTRDIAERALDWAAYKQEGRLADLEKLDAERAWERAREDLLETLSLYHEDQSGVRIDLRTKEGLEEYHRVQSKTFLPTTFAATFSKTVPASRAAVSAGRLATLAYSAYAWIRLGATRRIVGRCPLTTFYVAAIAQLADSRAKGPAGMSLARPYFEMLGQPWPPHETDWASVIEQTYFRIAKPLYGAQ